MAESLSAGMAQSHGGGRGTGVGRREEVRTSLEMKPSREEPSLCCHH